MGAAWTKDRTAGLVAGAIGLLAVLAMFFMPRGPWVAMMYLLAMLAAIATVVFAFRWSKSGARTGRTEAKGPPTPQQLAFILVVSALGALVAFRLLVAVFG